MTFDEYYFEIENISRETLGGREQRRCLSTLHTAFHSNLMTNAIPCAHAHICAGTMKKVYGNNIRNPKTLQTE